MDKQRKKLFDNFMVVLWIMAVLITSLNFAFDRVVCCDYVSINGDFQSYNVFRRILDGQTPYYDFANYIGMAPVFVNLPLIALNNTFKTSLFVTNFMSNIVFSVAVFLLIYLISRNKYASALISAVISKVINTKILLRLLGPKYGYIYTEYFTGLYTPSNSMRGVRSFLPFLLVIFALLYKRLKGKNTTFLTNSLNEIKVLSVAGIVQGLLLVWSNDFSLACVAAFLVTFVFLQIFIYKNTLKNFAIKLRSYIACFVAGGAVSAAVVTNGHPMAFLKSMSRTAEYQFFYFNGLAGKPLLPYIFTNVPLLITTAIYLAMLIYYLVKLVKGNVDDCDVAAVFLLLSIAAGTYAYIISGSGYNFKEALVVYSIFAIVAFAIKLVLHILPSFERICNYFCVALLSVFAMYFSFVAYKSATAPAVGTYMDGLGGTSTLTKALVEAKDIVGDGTVFSSYATGLELVTNQFQPTGYDYIIHCLGSDAREKYVSVFREEQPEFIQTPSMDVAAWVATENWFFYREFLNSYEKVFMTEYSRIWQKCEEKHIDADVDFTVTQLDDGSVEIDLSSDCKEDFIAELYIDYNVKFGDLKTKILALGRKYLLARRNACFDAECRNIALPACSCEYIPVQMKNGQGTTVLSGALGESFVVTVNDVQYTGAYTPYYKSI